MSAIDRRDFIKSVSGLVGAAALAGIVPTSTAEAKTPNVADAKQVYEVYALKYAGPFERKLAMALFNTGWNEDVKINFYIWVIRAPGGETILVDTGTGPSTAKQRNIASYVPTEALLARMGVTPEQVRKVVLTHMHYDHVGGMENYPELFPGATFYVQKKEYDFWINNPIAQRAPYKGLGTPIGNQRMQEMAQDKRLVIVDGDKSIAPGVHLLLAPGHTPGLQAVLLRTAKGATIVGSDSAHLARSYKDDVPSSLITDLPAWLHTYDKLRACAPVENIFPGHDGLMATAYPAVTDGVTRLA